MAVTDACQSAADGGERSMSREWHWHPDLPIPVSPLFDWPPRPAAAVKWLAGYWLAASMIVFEVATACLVWYLLQPSLETTATLAVDWIALMYLRNLQKQSISN